MSIKKDALIRATALGTVLQLAMVVSGHFITAIALLFAPLGVGISFLAGLLYGRWAGRNGALTGGALAGGLCAFLGIALSYGLGDVTAAILALGTLSSAVGGTIGGWLGARLAGRGSLATST